MATVSHYEYTKYDGTLFYPGTARTLAWGPWPFAVKGIVVTAHPFDLSTAYRALTVTAGGGVPASRTRRASAFPRSASPLRPVRRRSHPRRRA